MMVTLQQRLSLDPMSHCQNYGHPWSTMIQCFIVTKTVSIWRSIMVNDGQPLSNVVLWQTLSQYEKKSCPTIFQCRIVTNICLRVYNIYLRVYIPWVYNIYPLGLTLFPWVYNPLGLLFSWVYNINPFRVYIPWIYNINPLGLILFPWVYNNFGF